MSAWLVAAAWLQAMPGMDMPGMKMPMPAPSATEAKPAGQAGPPALVGHAPPPPAPRDHHAERLFPAAAMERARAVLRAEHGGARYAMVDLPILEWQPRGGRDGYEWNGEAWYGDDRHRVVLRSEGHGARGRPIDDAEAQLLLSTPLDPYWDVQFGVRQDFRAGDRPTYAVIAAEGLAPFWIEVEGSIFLSDAGDVTARIEARHDARVTQALILQPRIELNLAAQDVRSTRTGAGLSDAELGLRLRYELVREIAPYVGVQYERRFGDARRFARVGGERAGGAALVVGVASFF